MKPNPAGKTTPAALTIAERKTMSRPYRRLHGKRPLSLSSNVHARKMPASLYREPGDPRFAQDGLNHANQRRADWLHALHLSRGQRA